MKAWLEKASRLQRATPLPCRMTQFPYGIGHAGFVMNSLR